jgi:hypothetical protein
MITAQDLRARLLERYPLSWASAQILDATFDAVPMGDVATFSAELGAKLFEDLPSGWQTWEDCDNFAHEAQGLACRKHFIARYAGAGGGEGVAFGQISYTRDIGGAHRINVFLGDDGALHEYEPQSRREITLSGPERNTVDSPYFT